MPARSATVFVLNASGKDLNLVVQSQHLDHGEWSGNGMPPNTIPGMGFGRWESESDGFMTGTEGRVSYTMAGMGGNNQVQFHWDNPYAGSNTYGWSAPPGFKVTQSGGDGNNAMVNFIVQPGKLLPPPAGVVVCINNIRSLIRYQRTGVLQGFQELRSLI